MKIYHLTLLFVVLANGLLSVFGARLKCPSVSIANGSYKIRSKGRIIVYKCSRGFYLLGEAYAACIKGKWDSNPPVCLKPGCPAINNLLNGEVHESWRSSLLRFSCNPGYKLIGPPYIYCNGRQWNASPPQCQAIDIKCDFEKKTTCNWIIDDYDEEDFNWRLQQHEPPSRVLKTGPLHDHTLSPNTTGHYLVLETSDYIPSSKPARIHSPVFPQPSDNSSCFIFWYHMYGNTIGTLNLFLNNNLAFQKHGNHGDRWIKGVISLSENVTSKDLQIIIEGSYGGGYTGDIGLDDFSIGNGTDCLSSTVKSCVGRCYEDKNDKSSCLCNPECSVDASCCEDFLDVCSIESTTPFFEASTGVEDSTQVYSDSSGTTDYETSFSELISSTELGFATAVESSTSSSSVSSSEDVDLIYSKADVERFEKTELSNNSDHAFYSSSTNPQNVNTKSQSTAHDVTEVRSLSTTPYLQKEQKTTNLTEGTIIINRFSTSALVNIPTTERTTLSNPKNNITFKSFYNIMTEVTSRQSDHLFKTNSYPRTPTKADTTIFTKFLNNSTKANTVHQTISTKMFFFNVSTDKTFIPQNKSEKNYQTTPTKVNIEKITKSLINSTQNPILTQPISEKTFSFNVSTEKTLILINKNQSNTTQLPVKINTLITKEFNEKKSFTTKRTVLLKQPTTPFNSTEVYQTTTIPNSTSSSTFKSVAKSLTPSMDEARISTMATSSKITPVQSSTSAIFKNITPPLGKTKLYFNFTTVSPLLDNVTTSISDQTKMSTSKLKSKKIVNDSHTHLQTTSGLPPLFNATEELISFTTIVTHTVTTKLDTVNSSKKWKSIYKPKDRFIFSAVQRNKDSKSKTYVILSVCVAVIGAISALLVVLFIRKRRIRFVNGLEEADTDILYHSSQEMLDLHVARPNH